ncbi:MAG: hypothetical protein JNJ58_06865 [Chitinophagaceae bacterium]|nr:hypothetical protein [Chitinophagaceae bacterium]
MANEIKITKSNSEVVNTLPIDSNNRNIIYKYEFSKPIKSDKIILFLELDYILLSGKVDDFENIVGSLKLNTSFTIHSVHSPKDNLGLLHECISREIEYFKTLFYSGGIKNYPTDNIYIPTLVECEPILNELFYLDNQSLS